MAEKTPLKRKVATPAVANNLNCDDDNSPKRKCRRKDNLKPPQLPPLTGNVPQTAVGQSSSSSADVPITTPFTNAASKGVTLTQETARTKETVKDKILRLRERMPHYVIINTEDKMRPLMRRVSAFAITCDCQSKIA